MFHCQSWAKKTESLVCKKTCIVGVGTNFTRFVAGSRMTGISRVLLGY